jgi:hypothetical protein
MTTVHNTHTERERERESESESEREEYLRPFLVPACRARRKVHFSAFTMCVCVLWCVCVCVCVSCACALVVAGLTERAILWCVRALVRS